MKLALILVLAGAFAAEDAAQGRPEIDLVSRTPIVVAGSGFAARERVRIAITSPVRLERVVRAGTLGRFRTRFDVSIRDCASVRLTARGNRGSRTSLAIDSVAGCPATE